MLSVSFHKLQKLLFYCCCFLSSTPSLYIQSSYHSLLHDDLIFNLFVNHLDKQLKIVRKKALIIVLACYH